VAGGSAVEWKGRYVNTSTGSWWGREREVVGRLKMGGRRAGRVDVWLMVVVVLLLLLLLSDSRDGRRRY
jgi:hypothetical protein